MRTSSGGWHHGDDIFAPLGAPVLACASGMVFSVGWNAIGGNRLWLRDGQGNLFYYAHLSAFTPLAINGNKVNAGDVLGFVGNTGDAQGTPSHLHFEIHPVGLLGLGYDGVVNPDLVPARVEAPAGRQLRGRRRVGAAAHASETRRSRARSCWRPPTSRAQTASIPGSLQRAVESRRDRDAPARRLRLRSSALARACCPDGEPEFPPP